MSTLTYAARDATTMLRRNLRRVQRYPSMTLMLVGILVSGVYETKTPVTLVRGEPMRVGRNTMTFTEHDDVLHKLKGSDHDEWFCHGLPHLA